MRHFLNLMCQDRGTILQLLADAARLKSAASHGEFADTLRHKVVALIFEKPSLRTRVSFEAGISATRWNESVLQRRRGWVGNPRIAVRLRPNDVAIH